MGSFPGDCRQSLLLHLLRSDMKLSSSDKPSILTRMAAQVRLRADDESWHRYVDAADAGLLGWKQGVIKTGGDEKCLPTFDQLYQNW